MSDALRDTICYISFDLDRELRLVMKIEQEDSVEGLVTRILDNYIETKYGKSALADALRRIISKRKQAEESELDLLRAPTPKVVAGSTPDTNTRSLDFGGAVSVLLSRLGRSVGKMAAAFPLIWEDEL